MGSPGQVISKRLCRNQFASNSINNIEKAILWSLNNHLANLTFNLKI
tara:strand:- start:238 stop:378 length:141 start_codon:yes stop_codon:yes gene_type:complete